ncbi:MAG: S9 family peptidase [Gammaproteobacteria bacterium]|nr:S9 family peptidase [Gammaproteobacteria bacterium]
MQKFKRLPQLTTPAPNAGQREHLQTHHGHTWNDPYFWLRDTNYPDVTNEEILDYVKAENAYYADFLKPHNTFVDTIFAEFKGREKEEKSSVPVIHNGYEYQQKFEAGEEYPIHVRKNLTTGEQDIYLNEPELAKEHEYFVISSAEISPDNRYLAYSVDTSGDERYDVFIRDLTTGEYLADVLHDSHGDLLWAADSMTLLYAELESDRWFAHSIKAHRLGEAQSNDKTLLHEKDNGYFIGFDKTSDDEFIIINSSQGESAEVYVVPADLSTDLVQISSRDDNFTLSVDHAHGNFYILANDTHKNFRLARVNDKQPQQEHWETLQAGSDDVFMLDFQTFQDFIVIETRERGLPLLSVRDYDGNSEIVPFEETIFDISIGNNGEFNQPFVRLNYQSMVTPHTVYDYYVSDKRLDTRKVDEIPSGYDASQYESRRIMVPARDGVEIPVSLVYKKGFTQDASQPLYLYGYGGYGHTVTPTFSRMVLSALDRGFVYAIAHVRGSSMMGYQWYLDGKLKKRTNTFNDFVDVGRYLVAENYVAEGNISIAGRSAGGELMGAVVIQTPELWRSVNLGVPFVDVLNTMLDGSLPLTPPEWKEWGNPIEDAEYFELLKSYSPYDNIEEREYPPMFVSGGLNDPRVTYWEPAKWVAKMRKMKTDNNLTVMRMNMGAGHFANSGRYGRLRDYAEEYVFMFLAHGITE